MLKKAKAVIIKEPIVTRSKTQVVKGKGKEKATKVPQDSSLGCTYDRKLRAAIEQSKLDALVSKIASQAGTSASKPS